MPAPANLQDYDVLYTIGSGSYGTCKKVRRRKDGKIFVWKEMDYGSMTESEKQMLVSEVNLLRELKHANIVGYQERVIDKSRQVIYLIMEYCEGGDLAALIKRYQRDGRHFDEEVVWKTLAQCASALNECHKRKDGKSILHRDLKPANIFLDAQKNVKLGDFGLARVLHHETSFAKTFVGTPYYMSPEQMNKLSYNEKSDIWSLGCVLYEMCTHHPPFLASNQRELACKIRAGHYSKLPSRYSSELSQLIDKMLSVECSARPSIEALSQCKQVAKYLPTLVTSRSSISAASEPITQDSNRKLIEREAKLAQREARNVDLERRLQQKEVDLNQRSSKLDALEVELRRRLAAIEEREKNAEVNIRQRRYAGTGLQERALNRVNDEKDEEPCTEKPITPILCRVKKLTIDSPTKHVSFVDDKENDIVSVANKMMDVINKDPVTTDLHNEFRKRRELKERLERAKLRAAQLKAAEKESKIRSRHLLNMR